MKIKFLATAAMMALGLGIQAQKNNLVSIEWGENAPLIKNHDRVSFIGNPEMGYVQVSENFKKKEIGLYRFSSGLKYEGSHTEIMIKSKNIMFESIVEFDNQAFFLFSDFDKANQSEKLYVQEVDLLKGKFLDSPMLLIETNGKVIGTRKAISIFASVETDKFKVIAPENNNRILLYYKYESEEKQDKKNYEKFVFHLYDHSWKKIWKREVTMPHSEFEMNILNFKLIGDDVFAFMETMSGKLNPDTKKPEYDELRVLHISSEDTEPKEYLLEIDKLYFKDLILGRGFGDKIMIGGYVQPKKKSSSSTGYFTAIFNPDTKSLEGVNQYKFSDDLITSFERASNKRKLEKEITKGKDPGISGLITREIVKKNDGGWIMVGEEFFVVVTDVTGNRGYSYRVYDYYFQNLIVSSVGPEGNEEWTVKVPKNQHFFNGTYGSGISSFVHNDNVYIFHLDNVKNKNIGDNDVPVEFRNFKEGCLMAVKIDPSGKMDRISLFDLGDEQKVILPTGIEEVAPGILLSSSRKSFKGAPQNTNMPALIYLK